MTNMKKKSIPKDQFRLFTVVRSDIPPGYQLAQTVHAVADLVYQCSDKVVHWKNTSNTVICLQTENENTLKEKFLEAIQLGFEPIIFNEPDLKNQFTSFAFVAKWDSGKKLRLDLALK
jgi:hypothetical protein